MTVNENTATQTYLTAQLGLRGCGQKKTDKLFAGDGRVVLGRLWVLFTEKEPGQATDHITAGGSHLILLSSVKTAGVKDVKQTLVWPEQQDWDRLKRSVSFCFQTGEQPEICEAQEEIL